jgi:hypothetical protein
MVATVSQATGVLPRMRFKTTATRQLGRAAASAQ